MKNIDFPAGHSMDTNWFAVDKNGNIGFFNSDQEGTCPIQVEIQTSWDELFYKYTIPITKGLKQLFLDKNTIQQLLKRCTTDTLKEILKNEYSFDGYILLLTEGKTWEDLHFKDYFAKSKDDCALLLSPIIPIYLIYDSYNIYDKLVASVENGIISKACEFTMYEDEGNENRITVSELGIFTYNHETLDYSEEPYIREYFPNIPLNIDQFSKEKANEIPTFAEIAFGEQQSIHPMEFFSCRSFGGGFYETTQNWEEKGYVKVRLHDDKWAYCLLPIADQMRNEMKLRQCHKCYKGCFGYPNHANYANLDSFQDYPPVLLIRDFYHYDDKEQSKYNNVLNCLSKYLKITKYSCYLSYCVKCYQSNKEKDKREFSNKTLELKFQQCHKHFEIEIETLQPLLLIAIEENVKNLIERYYQIENFVETPYLCSVAIKDKTYPLLVVNKIETKKDKEKLINYLRVIAEDIKTILEKERNLLTPKQRVIKIEECEE
jgi:hypothetical protein